MTKYLESSDLARCLAAVGSPCRTAHSVRARVVRGYLHPTATTLRGCELWSEEDAAEVLILEQLGIRHRATRRAPRQANFGFA